MVSNIIKENDKISSIKNVFLVSWKVFRGNIKPISLLSVITALPIYFSGTVPGYFYGNNSLVFIIGLIIDLFFSTLSILPMTLLIETIVVRESPIDLKEILRKSISQIPASLVALILAIAIILGMALLLVIPGLIYAVNYYFVGSAVAIRHVRGMEALRYSKRIVQGNWWTTFITLMLATFIGITLHKMVMYLGLVLFEKNLLSVSIIFMANRVVAGFSYVVSVILFLSLDYSRSASNLFTGDGTSTNGM